MVGCGQHHVTEEDTCPGNVPETFTKEEAVVPSEATLITWATTNSSYGSIEKGEESFVTDKYSDSREQKKEVTANSNDDNVQKEEEKVLHTGDVPESTTLKTFQKNNLIANQTKVCTIHTCVFEIVIKEIILNLF